MIIVYTTHRNQKEAEKIGLILVKKRLAACAIVIPGATSFYWWSPSSATRAGRTSPTSVGEPPRRNKIEKSREAILLIKTLKEKFPQIKKEIKLLHSYTIPCILEISVTRLNKDYKIWLEKEIK